MIRAYISEHGLGRHVNLAVVREDESGPISILRLGTATRFEAWEPITDPCVQIEPTIRLDVTSARAVLDSLQRHFNGDSDTRALRKDYDAERARVDRLLDAVTGIATGRP
jgi:hypothetical protein